MNKDYFLRCQTCNTAYLADKDYTKEKTKSGYPDAYTSYCTNCDQFIEGHHYTNTN
ncbi:hypothetical protein QFZ72_005074 [Bacillus sp. V2I10]|nr:hypothetical protein [Bacillus sp. V2I10]MDQ0861595.1 hypothetical protein [Bacillus sp. V2I10]